MQALGCFAQPVVELHPERARSGGRRAGGRERAGAAEALLYVRSLSATHLRWYTIASVPALYLD